MADYVVSAELELFISDFKKNISAAQNSLQNFEKQVKSASESTKNVFDGKSISNFSSKLESLGSKINKGTSAWGLDIGKFYDKGSSMFKSFGVDVDKFASHFGMSGKLMSAIVACVTALVKLGQEMDEARAEIVKGTGAIGDALDDLEASAKQALVQGVGASVKQTGKLIADLNTRFGMTGKTLEKTAVEFGHFAKAAGVDVGNAVNNIADVMARWNVPMEKSKDLMNQLTKASQISGASVDELVSAVNSGSVYFEQFGFNLTESIAMLSSFRKNGIETSTVMTGLRTALSKFSQEGRNAKTAFAEVTAQIKSAASETEAMQISVETFGTRAGAEMFKAIRSGSASLEEFTGELRNAGYALDDTYDAVRTSKDAMADLKNSLKGTFGGFGQAFSALWKGILDGIREIVLFIEPIVTPIAEVFKRVFTKISEFISWFVRNVRECIQKNEVMWKAFVSLLNQVGNAVKNIFGDIAGIFKSVFGFIFSIIGGQWEKAWIHAQLVFWKFGRVCQYIIDFVANLFVKLINFVGNKINEMFPRMTVNIAKFFDGLKNALPDWMVDFVEPQLFKDISSWMDKARAMGLDEAAATEAAVQTMAKVYKKSGTMFQEIAEVKLEEQAIAGGKSVNQYIDELEARLKKLEKGYGDEIGDIGDMPSFGGSVGGMEEGKDGDKRSAAWQQKRLQQQLDAIEKEKNEKLNALAEEGMAQADLDKINEVYAKKQIEIFRQLQELKKDADLKSVESYSNAEEEKLKLNEYYADEEQKYILEVSTNTVKEKIKIEEKSTQWREKVLQQEIDAIEEKRKLEVQSMKDSGKRTKEIRDMQKQSIDEQIAKYRELMEIKKQNDLESAKGAEEKADVEKYYADESASYIKKLWETMLEETSGQTEKWYKTVGSIFMKVGNAIKNALTKTVNVVKNIFSNFMKIVKINPDDVLNMFLEGADAILTFFTDVLPQLPEMMEGVLNIITVLIDTLTQPEMLDKITKGVEDLIVKTVDYLVKNINKILTGLGKLIGALIKGIGKAISEIDWIELFGEILKGVWNAITEILNGVWEAVKNIGKAIADWWTDGKDFTTGQGYGKNSTGSSAGDLAIDLLVPFGFLRHFFATGTNNAPSGLALVGEEGPELIDFRGGERVYNANATRDIMSSNGGGASVNNWNVTFNNLNDTSAYTMMRQMKNWQREMAISGVF